MAKRLKAKIGEYEKDGQTKGEYADIGVILSNSNGEYILMNPTVDLAGVLMAQRILAEKTGKKVGDRVMVNIWDGEQRQQSHDKSPGYDQSASGYGAGGRPDDDEIPFVMEWRA